MSGSNPDADDVTRSTGTGPGGAFGFSFISAATRCCTFWIRTLFVGPRFEPAELSASYGEGVPVVGLRVADGRPWKYFGEVQYCPMSSEPITCPLEAYTRLPLALS